MDDIEKLQLSQNRDIFQNASKLFLNKWKVTKYKKMKNLIAFLDYFAQEWLISHSGWYEGLGIYTPSQNNALEATNNVIKDGDTYRESLVLPKFLIIA